MYGIFSWISNKILKIFPVDQLSDILALFWWWRTEKGGPTYQIMPSLSCGRPIYSQTAFISLEWGWRKYKIIFPHFYVILSHFYHYFFLVERKQLGGSKLGFVVLTTCQLRLFFKENLWPTWINDCTLSHTLNVKSVYRI